MNEELIVVHHIIAKMTSNVPNMIVYWYNWYGSSNIYWKLNDISKYCLRAFQRLIHQQRYGHISLVLLHLFYNVGQNQFLLFHTIKFSTGSYISEHYINCQYFEKAFHLRIRRLIMPFLFILYATLASVCVHGPSTNVFSSSDLGYYMTFNLDKT